MCPDGDIQGRDGLVADDEIWPQCQGTGNANALALSTGEFMWVAPRGLQMQTNPLQKPGYPRFTGDFVAPAVHDQGFFQRSAYALARVQG
ncbi:hypothetical protein AGMMS49960_17610 [Betaproteobacteria bacterium]|nr:hypothetical protein AGMMS49960_17610 [Betaproteobacteria bacterium]